MKREDFLELKKYLGGDYESAKLIVRFRSDITPYGFESYIADFFKQESYGFKTTVSGGMDDGGMDVKGVKKGLDGSMIYLIVQCKRWHKEHIQKKDVSKFCGDVSKNKQLWNPFLVFATTTWATKNAKRFCEENDILLLDYRKLLELNKEMSLEEWMENKIGGDEYEKIFSAWFRDRRQEKLNIQNNVKEELRNFSKDL